ncbi:unnamed protein product [Lactuca virosa]|uniref:Uncharacterized protein n=1 Tax=Lactuca virosa TaxID=75947 RepID=A0AAU9N9A0_9ASTR|nr:unnamed protein product [Lactuca virosa]
MIAQPSSILPEAPLELHRIPKSECYRSPLALMERLRSLPAFTCHSHPDDSAHEPSPTTPVSSPIIDYRCLTASSSRSKIIVSLQQPSGPCFP